MSHENKIQHLYNCIADAKEAMADPELMQFPEDEQNAREFIEDCKRELRALGINPEGPY